MHILHFSESDSPVVQSSTIDAIYDEIADEPETGRKIQEQKTDQTDLSESLLADLDQKIGEISCDRKLSQVVIDPNSEEVGKLLLKSQSEDLQLLRNTLDTCQGRPILTIYYKIGQPFVEATTFGDKKCDIEI